jgi:hypothetical protein
MDSFELSSLGGQVLAVFHQVTTDLPRLGRVSVFLLLLIPSQSLSSGFDRMCGART